MKVKAQKHEKYVEIWNSKPIGSRTPLAIWAPEMESSIYKRNRDRICLGHYAVGSYKNPAKDRGFQPWTIEITDTSTVHVGMVSTASSILEAVVDEILPNPIRYKQIWNTVGKRTDKHFYAWMPVPPSAEFVAVGMVGTSDEDPPPGIHTQMRRLDDCNRNPTQRPKSNSSTHSLTHCLAGSLVSWLTS